MALAGQRVLITGIAGFVGANLARALVDAGADVVGLDQVKTSPSLRALGVDVDVQVCDVTNWQRVHWELVKRPPDVVFHLAGKSHIKDCQDDPEGAWRANVQGTWAVLEACRKLPAGQIQAVVCASSNHVFGSSNWRAWEDRDPCGQTDVYGTSKGCVDLLTRAYGAMGLPVAALRHVNCFGPADPYRSHLVTGTICALLEGKPPIIRGDGTPIKGYLHVEDVCQAYLTVAKAVATAQIQPGVVVNVRGAPISVLSLVDLLIQIAGIKVVPQVLREDMSQTGYVEALRSDQLEALGWRAGPLREGLWQTWAWYREHGGMAWL